MYINGVLQSSVYTDGNATMDQTYQGGEIYNIGAYNNGSLLSNIRIDATTIWNKELTSAEVSELYNSGNGAQYITDSFYKPTTNDALNTNNGTAQGGLTYGLGKVGTAFQFNGSNSYIKFPNNSFSYTGDFTISLWFYYINGGQHQIIAGNFDYTGGATINGWNIFNPVPQVGNTTTNNPIQFTIGNGTSGVTLQATVRENPFTWYANNTWYHFVITRKAGQRTRIYRNGVLDVENASTLNPTYLPNTIPSIGAGYYASYPSTSSPLVQYFISNGSKVDALNVWSKELTSAEVTELYNSGNGKQYPN